MRIESYLQLRVTDDQLLGDDLSLRRAKVMVTWDPAPEWRVYAQALYKDGNRASNDRRLWVQELWVRRRVGAGWLAIGQMKPPFGMERFTSDAVLDTIDRSQPTDRLIPNGGLPRSFARDVGVQWDCGAAGRGWSWAVGLFLGNGALVEPYRNNGPLLAARASHRWVLPKTGSLQVGAAFSARRDRDIDFSNALPGTRPLGVDHFRGRDTRWDIEAALDAGRWRLRSEVLGASLSGADGQPGISARGWYAQATCVLGPRWEAVAKFEFLDPNRQVTDRHDIGWATLGINHFLRGHREKVQADLVIKRSRVGSASVHTLLLQYQRYL